MKQMKFTAPDDLRAAVKEQAAKESDGNESMLIRRALRAYLARAPLREHEEEGR